MLFSSWAPLTFCLERDGKEEELGVWVKKSAGSGDLTCYYKVYVMTGSHFDKSVPFIALLN
jgi:hypothetical protein